MNDVNKILEQYTAMVVPRVYDPALHQWKNQGVKGSDLRGTSGGICCEPGRKGQSFSVKPGTGEFHCYKCGRGGHLLGAISLKFFNGSHKPKGEEFHQAFGKFCELAGKENPFGSRAEFTPQQRVRASEIETYQKLMREWCQTGKERLHDGSNESKEALAHLQARGLSEDKVKVLQLGIYSRDDAEALRGRYGEDITKRADILNHENGRIIFPNMTDGISGIDHVRTATLYGEGATPKYKNLKGFVLPDGESPWQGTPPLFSNRALYESKHVVLVEGAFDAALAQAHCGFRFAAMLGKSFSKKQAAHLKGRGVEAITFCLDGEVGPRDIEKVAQRAMEYGLRPYVATITELLEDPASIINKEGGARFSEIIDKAKHPGEVISDRMVAEYGEEKCPQSRKDHIVDRLVDLLGGPLFYGYGYGERLTDHIVKELGCSYHWFAERVAAAMEGTKKEEEERAAREADAELKEEIRKLSNANLMGEKLIAKVEGALAKHSRMTAEGDVLRPLTPEELIEVERSGGGGMSTGLEGLDELGAEFIPGTLGLVAARPSHGKTALMANIAYNRVMEGDAVLYYALEGGRTLMQKRLFAIHVARVYGDADDPGRATTKDIGRFWRGEEINAGVQSSLAAEWEQFSEILKDRLHVVHCPGISVNRLRDNVLLMAEQNEVSSIFVDYVQKIEPETGIRKDSADHTMNSYITEYLIEHIATPLNIPVIAGAQLLDKGDSNEVRSSDQEGKSRPDKLTSIKRTRPTLAGFRGGGLSQNTAVAIAALNYEKDFLKVPGEPPAYANNESVIDLGVVKNWEGEAGGWKHFRFEPESLNIVDIDEGEAEYFFEREK